LSFKILTNCVCIKILLEKPHATKWSLRCRSLTIIPHALDHQNSEYLFVGKLPVHLIRVARRAANIRNTRAMMMSVGYTPTSELGLLINATVKEHSIMRKYLL
jgi:hypothetical protein